MMKYLLIVTLLVNLIFFVNIIHNYYSMVSQIGWHFGWWVAFPIPSLLAVLSIAILLS